MKIHKYKNTYTNTKTRTQIQKHVHKYKNTQIQFGRKKYLKYMLILRLHFHHEGLNCQKKSF